MADEISREALLIYLENIRTMETIIAQSKEKIPQIEEKKKTEETKMYELGNKKYSWVSHKPAEPEFCLSSKIKKSFVLALISFVVMFAWIILCMGEFPDSWHDFYRFFFIEYTDCLFFIVLPAIVILVSFIISIVSFISDKKQYRFACERYPDELREYEESERRHREEKYRHDEECRTLIQKSRDVCKEGDRQKAEIQSEIESIRQLLQEAYSANIIPLQFRNIQGVYYLYDYLSTSTQTLTDALMQCNLDAIKQKLDEVINLQGAALIQQAQANAAIFEQNQRILEAAEATMNNTAIAAKYARISAVNSQLAVRMQSKQLAYQRADFWLK